MASASLAINKSVIVAGVHGVQGVY